MINFKGRSLRAGTRFATFMVLFLVTATAHAILGEPNPTASGGSVQTGSNSLKAMPSFGLLNVAGSWTVVASAGGGALSTAYSYTDGGYSYGAGALQVTANLNASITSAPALATAGSYTFSSDLVSFDGTTVVPGSLSSGSGVFSISDWSDGTLDLINTAPASSSFTVSTSSNYDLQQFLNISFANVPSNQNVIVDLPFTSTVNSVPEPASVVLLFSSLGAIGLATVWRRRRRAV